MINKYGLNVTASALLTTGWKEKIKKKYPKYSYKKLVSF
jgi:hypothetical protein